MHPLLLLLFTPPTQGNIGILDVSSRGYTTVMRSHTARILAMSIDPIRRHLATVAEDHTIRVWDVDTMQQVWHDHPFTLFTNFPERGSHCLSAIK